MQGGRGRLCHTGLANFGGTSLNPTPIWGAVGYRGRVGIAVIADIGKPLKPTPFWDDLGCGGMDREGGGGGIARIAGIAKDCQKLNPEVWKRVGLPRSAWDCRKGKMRE
jgi:hypothetical protein